MDFQAQTLQILLSMSQKLGDLAASVEAIERTENSQNTEIAGLDKRMDELCRERAEDKDARRHLPDELVEYVRKEHEKAKARAEFYEDLRTSLLKKGIIGMLGVLAIAILNWGRQAWPSLKVWLIETLNR